MKESVSYTVLLNIMFTFIVIVFAFLSASIIFFKSNKSGNLITNSLEKYAGFNDKSKAEISTRLASIGYNVTSINCESEITDDNAIGNCKRQGNTGNLGYCIYLCLDTSSEDNSEYYYYKVRSVMPINIPIINNLVKIPIYNVTNIMFNFDCYLSGNNCIKGE